MRKEKKQKLHKSKGVDKHRQKNVAILKSVTHFANASGGPHFTPWIPFASALGGKITFHNSMDCDSNLHERAKNVNKMSESQSQTTALHVPLWPSGSVWCLNDMSVVQCGWQKHLTNSHFHSDLLSSLLSLHRSGHFEPSTPWRPKPCLEAKLGRDMMGLATCIRGKFLQRSHHMCHMSSYISLLSLQINTSRSQGSWHRRHGN